MEQQFHCTTCPMECLLVVSVDGQGGFLSAAGNRCARGEDFARQEIVRPVRVLTSTVPVRGNRDNILLPVRSSEAFPLDLHKRAMDEIRRLSVQAPIRMGDVILPALAGWDTPLVAACDMDA